MGGRGPRRMKIPFRHCGTKTPPKRDCTCARCEYYRSYRRQWYRDQKQYNGEEFRARLREYRHNTYVRNRLGELMNRQLAYQEKKERFQDIVAECECGCGTKIQARNGQGGVVRFVHGHNLRRFQCPGRQRSEM
jgi:hypothetical protein